MITMLFLLVAGLPLTLLLLYLVGHMLPDKWQVSCSHSYFVGESDMTMVITDVPHFHQWKQVDRSEWVHPENLEWKEWYAGHLVIFKSFHEADGHSLHQISIRNTAPFSINRTYITARKDQMTFLTVADEFIITQPIMKILSRLFYDHESYLKKEMQRLDHFLQNR
jgi:hypothetical protein